MSYRIQRRAAALFFLVSVSAVLAQSPSAYDLKVEISVPHESLLIGYTVSLYHLQRPEDVMHSSVEFGDTYVFRHIPAGDYAARVFARSGELLKEEIVRVGGGDSLVRINVPQSQIQQQRPGVGLISVRQLQNPPSRKALQAFQAAQKHSAAGQNDKAAAELEKAIRFSPEFALAHTNMAAIRIRLHDYERAVDEATLAMQISSPNVLDLNNRALAQWALARYEDAIRSAEQALRLDANSLTAHFVLGSLLAEDPRTVRQGIPHLERAAEKFPDAARNLARARAKLM